ncbi:MAG: type II secretion system F family protein [Nanoarchaeota archaeon]|nr:type II secretion system F family protein [Nanoarchaeota archaeon]
MIANYTPLSYRRKIRSLLALTESKRTAESFIDRAIVVSVLIGLGAGFLVLDLFLPLFAVVAVATFGFFHGFLYLAIERRIHFVEEILPDALQLMAANSRAGYIPSRALVLSARKEFGPLGDAIRRAGKEIMTGKSLEEGLLTINKKINSSLLEKSVRLIIEGTRAGGRFAQLLLENAEDIRRMQEIKKEVHASIMMYIIFIGFAGVVAAPGLYALSGFLIDTISKLGASATLPETASAAGKFASISSVSIDPIFLFWFSLAAILITVTFGSLILGLIATGKEKSGLRFLPFFVIVSLAIFFVSRIVIGSIFGGLVPG